MPLRMLTTVIALAAPVAGAGPTSMAPPAAVHRTAGPDGRRTLDLAALQSLAQAMRGFWHADPIDSPSLDPTMAGRAFELTVAPQPNGCTGYPSLSYSTASGEFTVLVAQGTVDPARISPRGAIPATSPGEARNGDGTRLVRYIAIACDRASDYVSTGTDGVSAVPEVTHRIEKVLALAADDFDAAKAMQTTHADEAAARELTWATRIRIRGVLGEWRPGQVVVCFTQRRGPTLDLPIDLTTNACTFKTTSIHVDIIDTRTGSSVTLQ